MSTGKTMLGVLAGFAAGALVGVLLAPEKGSETRKKIAKMGEDYAGDLTDKFNELRDTINEKLGNVEDNGMKIVEKGKSKIEECIQNSTLKNLDFIPNLKAKFVLPLEGRAAITQSSPLLIQTISSRSVMPKGNSGLVSLLGKSFNTSVAIVFILFIFLPPSASFQVD
jgi:gas vesicle protein